MSSMTYMIDRAEPRPILAYFNVKTGQVCVVGRDVSPMHAYDSNWARLYEGDTVTITFTTNKE